MHKKEQTELSCNAEFECTVFPVCACFW